GVHATPPAEKGEEVDEQPILRARTGAQCARTPPDRRSPAASDVKRPGRQNGIQREHDTKRENEGAEAAKWKHPPARRRFPARIHGGYWPELASGIFFCRAASTAFSARTR